MACETPNYFLTQLVKAHIYNKDTDDVYGPFITMKVLWYWGMSYDRVPRYIRPYFSGRGLPPTAFTGIMVYRGDNDIPMELSSSDQIGLGYVLDRLTIWFYYNFS